MFPNDSTLANAHVIVATPGRLVEHLLDERGHINLSMLRFLVVDEADRFLGKKLRFFNFTFSECKTLPEWSGLTWWNGGQMVCIFIYF